MAKICFLRIQLIKIPHRPHIIVMCCHNHRLSLIQRQTKVYFMNSITPKKKIRMEEFFPTRKSQKMSLNLRLPKRKAQSTLEIWTRIFFLSCSQQVLSEKKLDTMVRAEGLCILTILKLTSESFLK